MKVVYALFMLLFLGACDTNVAPLEITSLADYHHPTSDEVVIKTKVPYIDRNKAIEYGDLLYHKPTAISRSSCASCHDLRFSGRSVFNKEAGGGLYREKYKSSWESMNGSVFDIPVDRKPFKNITTLNSYRVHDSGMLLHHGAQSDFPLEAQIDSATNAHFMNDLVLEARHDAHLQRLSKLAFGEQVNSGNVKSAISAFEQTLTTSETNASKGIITRKKGFILFEQMCKDCHFSRRKSQSLALNPIHENVIPQSLENVRESAGFFQTSEDITLYKAIKRHKGVHVKDDLSSSEIYAIRSFLNTDLFDKRYSE